MQKIETFLRKVFIGAVKGIVFPFALLCNGVIWIITECKKLVSAFKNRNTMGGMMKKNNNSGCLLQWGCSLAGGVAVVAILTLALWGLFALIGWTRGVFSTVEEARESSTATAVAVPTPTLSPTLIPSVTPTPIPTPAPVVMTISQCSAVGAFSNPNSPYDTDTGSPRPGLYVPHGTNASITCSVSVPFEGKYRLELKTDASWTPQSDQSLLVAVNGVTTTVPMSLYGEFLIASLHTGLNRITLSGEDGYTFTDTSTHCNCQDKRTCAFIWEVRVVYVGPEGSTS